MTWSGLLFARDVGRSIPREEGTGRGCTRGTLSRFQPKHGCCGYYPSSPYFTRIAISRALFCDMELTRPRSSMSRRFLVWKLGAAALFWVSSVGPYAGSCCYKLRVFGAEGCFDINGCKGVPHRERSARELHAEQPVEGWSCNRLHSRRSPSEVFSNNSSLQELSIWSHCHGPTRPFSALANQALVISVLLTGALCASLSRKLRLQTLLMQGNLLMNVCMRVRLSHLESCFCTHREKLL